MRFQDIPPQFRDMIAEQWLSALISSVPGIKEIAYDCITVYRNGQYIKIPTKYLLDNNCNLEESKIFINNYNN